MSCTRLLIFIRVILTPTCNNGANFFCVLLSKRAPNVTYLYGVDKNYNSPITNKGKKKLAKLIKSGNKMKTFLLLFFEHCLFYIIPISFLYFFLC